MCNNQKISLFGYGGWGAGLQGWQNVSEKLARQSIQLAYELGVNLFDTSPLYGRGTSERIFGEELSLVRKNILLSTKFGLVETENRRVIHDLSYESMMRELDESLARLKTDYLDYYFIHYPDGS